MGLGTPGLVPLLDEEILPPAKVEEPVAAQGGTASPPPLGDSGIVTSIKTIDPRQTVDNQAEWPDPVGTVQLGWDFEVVSRTPTMLSVWDGIGTGATASGTGTVVGLELTPVNYVSTNTAALQIDQTDPTNVFFTSSAGGLTGGDIVGLFGQGSVIMVNTTGPSTGSYRELHNGTVVNASPNVSYSSTSGTFTFSKPGFYMYTISGTVEKPTSPTGSDQVTIVFNEGAGLLDGLPITNKSVYLGGQTGITGASVAFAETIGILTIANTTVTPKVYASWNDTAAWNVNVSIANVFGPGALGGSGTGSTDPYVFKNYGFVYFFGDNFANSIPADVTGTIPSGNKDYRVLQALTRETGVDNSAGSVPAHYVVDTTYYGDTDNPMWYPDGQMYVSFGIGPMLLGLAIEDFTITVESWDLGSPPSDLMILPLYSATITGSHPSYNFHYTFQQGYVLYLPHTTSYVGTSFRIKMEVAGLPTQYLYYKYAAEDAYPDAIVATTSTCPGVFNSGSNNTWQWSRGDTIVSSGNSNYSEIHGNYDMFLARYPLDSTDQINQQIHLSLVNAKIWGDPETIVTWEWQTPSIMSNNYYFEGLSQNEYFTTLDDIYTPIWWEDVKPTIVFVPPTALLTNPADNSWTYSPVGHWIIQQPLGIDYWPQVNHMDGTYPTPSVWPLLLKINGVGHGIIEFVSGYWDSMSYQGVNPYYY